MSFMFVVGACILCKRTFTFNATHVPSLRVDGNLEPMCKECHTKANAHRVKNGVEPWPEPHPEAYEAEEVY